jgi:hypothetical protein
MANRYWVLGAGVWNTSSTTNWSAISGAVVGGASVPTAADNVFFDQAGTYTVTLTGALTCLNITVSAGTVTFSSTGTLAVSGSMSLVAATVWNATGTITFNSTATGKTITTNAVTISSSMTFNGAGGSWQLQDALTLGATRTITLTAGTLDLNGKTLTTGIYAGTGSGVRSLLSYSVPIIITGNSTTVISLGTTTNLSVDVRPTFQLDSSTAAGGTTRSMTWGASSNLPAVPNINVINGADTVTTGGTTTLNNLTFSGTFTGILGNATRIIYGNLTLKTGMSVDSGTLTTTFIGVGSQTITSAGLTLDFPISFNGAGGTWTLQDNLTIGETRITNLISGTLATGSNVLTTGAFNSNNANTRSLSIGGLGAMVLTGRNTSVLNVADSTGLSYSGGRIQLNAAGIAGETRSVLGALTGGTEANALNIEVYGGVDIIDFGSANRIIGDLFFLEFNGSTAAGTNFTSYGFLYLYGGDPGITNGMTVTGGNVAWTFAASSGTQAINTNGVVINNSVTLDGTNTIWEVSNVLNVTGTLTLANGTLKLPAGVASNVGSFVTTGTNQKYLQSTTAGTQATINAASGTNTVTYLTIQDSNASGGALWYADDLTDVNAGNNTGWIFAGHDIGFGTGSGGTCFGFGFRI